MSEIVDEDDIIGYVKKRRLTKEERIASILHGRDENNVAKKTAGLSNKEKMTSKPFMLTKHRDKVALYSNAFDRKYLMSVVGYR